jgi:hypothetical protein
MCIGQIAKADISNNNQVSKMIFQIRIANIIYADSSHEEISNLSFRDKINIQSEHKSYNSKSFNQLYSSYVILSSYDSSLKIFSNLIAFEIIWLSDDILPIKPQVLDKLKCFYCNYNLCGFLLSNNNLVDYINLIPDEIERYKVRYLDPFGKQQTFIPLNNFLEYFNKIKNKKKD